MAIRRVEIIMPLVNLPQSPDDVCIFAKIRAPHMYAYFSLQEQPGEGWYVSVTTAGNGAERMHDEPFPTAADAHHAGCLMAAEGFPKLTREISKRLAQQEEVRGDTEK